MLKRLFRILLAIVAVLAGLVTWLALSLRPNLPDTVFVPELASAGAPDAPYLVFGGTRGAGLEVVKLLRARGDRVTAFVRPTSNTTALKAMDVSLVTGDAMNPEEVARAFGNGEFRGVVTTIGCLRCNPPPDYLGNKHIIDAAGAAGVRRLILITSIGTGETRDALPWLSRWLLRNILPVKEQAEEHLIASGLDYTIIRPGGLPPATQATGRGVLTEDPDAFGFIGRPDLARLIVGCLDDGRCIARKFAALDPQRSAPWDSGD